MKKVALVFVLAVIVPSLVLAWLAVRSLRDQQFLLEKQQSLLYQGVADAVAKQVADTLADYQRSFTVEAAKLWQETNSQNRARGFDDALRKDWPLAQVGFVVTLAGDILSPSPYGRPEARAFCADNGRFLANRESVEVYWNPKQAVGNFQTLNAPPPPPDNAQTPAIAANYPQEAANQGTQLKVPSAPQLELGQAQTATGTGAYQQALAQNSNQLASNSPRQSPSTAQNESGAEFNRRGFFNRSKLEARNVLQQNDQQQWSKVAASEAEFRQLIGDATDGTLARFVDNKLKVLFWCRVPAESNLVFGAQLSLPRLIEGLRPLVAVEPPLQGEICIALLDDMARPMALTRPGFRATWKRPFVATEIGEELPHWEVAVYLLDPAKLARSAQTTKLVLGLLIATLLLAIGIGSWLIVADLNRQLSLARQKTDFVSNVSHELKTPLTSIRMFSELLAEGRVREPAKQRAYLGIITAETARLTRLINNVLDFARMERGEKKYNFQKCDVVSVARETADTYRPHLEANGFRFGCELPEAAVFVRGDRDALAQVVVNLLSNAEKYSNSRKEIELRVTQPTSPLPCAEIKVLDRGLGVPEGSEERIFEKFCRAHDTLSSGIQGSGLGLTLARQIARAHGGEVVYEPRDGGGSCFSLRLPLLPG
jgi:signal transduction histidine kinase